MQHDVLQQFTVHRALLNSTTETWTWLLHRIELFYYLRLCWSILTWSKGLATTGTPGFTCPGEIPYAAAQARDALVCRRQEPGRCMQSRNIFRTIGSL
jgi:hypothetical protein